MKIDATLVEEIAALARLRFNREETEAFAAQFADIVAFVEQLTEVDTSSIKEIHVHDRDDSALDGDEVQAGFSKEESLINAPLSDADLFLVPKVITGEEE
jgi:aspartyl-tRNA(Asn)/glutamyl-tRNA(Gln) amidotransferase subunit C